MLTSYNYDQIFVNALNTVLADYSSGKIQFHSEHDFLCNVFSECQKLMQIRGFPVPLKIYAQKSVPSCHSKQTKVDMVLGDDEVLVEFKTEPDYPGVNKPVVFYAKKHAQTKNKDGKIIEGSSIEGDIEKIMKYCAKGKCAHFVMVDEDGMHSKKDSSFLPKSEWKQTGKQNKKGMEIKYIHIYCDGAKQECKTLMKTE